MTTLQTTAKTPEDIELAKKHRLLDRIKDRLADREEEMADLRGDLERFEARYTMEVARLYAEFDEIEALIAEEEYKLVPDDEEIKKRAEELRRRAEESAARAAEDANADERAEPTAAAKKAYHELARAIHPDLALDNSEKERRHALMAELNVAYTSGDQAKLDEMVAGLRVSPDVIMGDGIGDQLVRAIRQIYQARTRIDLLKNERVEMTASELFDLKTRYDNEMAEGRDMLAQIAARTQVHIKKSIRRLNNLKMVNLAAEEHVKDTYGMDIEEFRKNAKR